MLKNKVHLTIFIIFCLFIISFSAAAESVNSSDANSSNFTAQQTYIVSGYVFDNNGIGLEGVLVQNDTKQVTTLESGHYSIADLPNGTYNLTYTKAGFDPDYLVITINDADNITANKTIFDTKPPGQVSGLRNDSPTQTNINLSWDTLVDANYYLVYRNSISLGYTKNSYWNDTNLTSDIAYDYEVKANDSYNNWGEKSLILTVRRAPLLDTTININNKARYTNSTNVTLYLTSAMGWMSFNNDNTNWTNWEPFAATKPWTLIQGDGNKIVLFSVSNDNSSQHDAQEVASIKLDTTKPAVTDLALFPSTPELNKYVDIKAKIGDMNPDPASIFVSVKSPDGNTSLCKMTELGLYYNCNFIKTSGYGRYDVTVFASDLAANTNNTEKTSFITTMKPYKNDAVTIIENIIKEINALNEANTTLELVTFQDITGNIELTMSNEIPPEIDQSIDSIPFRKVISIISKSYIENYLNWMNIKVYYPEDELKASGLDENSLRVSYYNASSSKWETPAKNGLNTTNMDNFSGFVWANVSHLGTFALVGSYPAPPKVQGSSSSGGGGGGGGGGPSGENFTNIIVKEKYDLQIYKDIVTSYKFKNISNPILSINIVGNVNAGEIGTAVEVLINTSSLVRSPAPGNVYKNVNVWVGTSGFGTSKNIKQAVITFRIENSWISSNNMKSSFIKMVRWDGSKWDQLETSEKTKDGTYIYFDAKTDSFSSFAITGMEKKEYITENADIIETTKPAAKIQSEDKKIDYLTNWFLLIGVFFAIGLIIEMYVRMKKK